MVPDIIKYDKKGKSFAMYFNKVALLKTMKLICISEKH